MTYPQSYPHYAQFLINIVHNIIYKIISCWHFRIFW